jgi:hypothetical protein
MSINTSCETCCFAKTSDDNNHCLFNIINSIKDLKKIDIVDKYYYIHDYQCKYGFSKKIFDQNKDVLSDTSKLIDHIKIKNLIKYYLVIDCPYNIDYTTISKINNLTIPPSYISFLSHQEISPDMVRTLEKHMKEGIVWKVHGYIDNTLTLGDKLRVALDTCKFIHNAQYIWINHLNYVSSVLSNEIVEHINFVINVEQPICNFLKSHVSDNIYTTILNTQTYQHITKNIDHDLEKGINTLSNTMKYYD